MITRIIIGFFIVGSASQLSALERVGQEHELKFTKDKIIIVNKLQANIPIKVTTVESKIEGLKIKLKEIIFDMQHVNNSTYTCTLKDKPLALEIMFNTTTDCEKGQ